MPKSNAEYFSHDTDASLDEKIIYLESIFGDSGYAWFFKMLETLGRSNNFEIDWSELKCGVLARKFNTTQQEFNKFIVAATNPDVRAFVIENGKLYSPGLKNRLEKMLDRRRKEAERIAERRAKQTVGATNESVDATNAQSKVKESKVKERKNTSLEGIAPAAENEKTKPNSEPKKNTPLGSAPPHPQHSHAKIETMEQAIVAASKWLDEHEQQKQFWISTARFSGDVSQEVAKFHSHYWRESGQHHKCKTDPIRFFQDGFLGWLINSKEFNRSQQGPSEAAKPQRATIMDYKPGRPALFEKQKF